MPSLGFYLVSATEANHRALNSTHSGGTNNPTRIQGKESAHQIGILQIHRKSLHGQKRHPGSVILNIAAIHSKSGDLGNYRPKKSLDTCHLRTAVVSNLCQKLLTQS